MNINRNITITLLSCLALLVSAAAAVAFSFPGAGKAEKVKAANGVVAVSLAKVSNGKAHFFKFSDGGKDISFFIVKAADGSVKTAFDACDACYREKKGYEQKDSMMICRNCNMKFAINRLGPNATGGCNPSYLPHKEAGGNVLVTVEDLRTGAKFF